MRGPCQERESEAELDKYLHREQELIPLSFQDLVSVSRAGQPYPPSQHLLFRMQRVVILPGIFNSTSGILRGQHSAQSWCRASVSPSTFNSTPASREAQRARRYQADMAENANSQAEAGPPQVSVTPAMQKILDDDAKCNQAPQPTPS